jgi:predicted nucleic acid-binding protein
LIVVDTSAWIELLRRTESRVDLALTRLLQDRAAIAATEVVVMELLAGARRRDQRAAVEEMLMSIPVLPLEGLGDYEYAADLFDDCRAGGEAVRSLLDCLVAVPAIAAGAAVLHAGRDFEVLARHTPLEVVSLDD